MTPFSKLLHRSAERLAVIPAQDRTPWANRAVAMARLLQLSQKEDLTTGASALSKLEVAECAGERFSKTWPRVARYKPVLM